MYCTLKFIHDHMGYQDWQHVRNYSLLQYTNDAVQEIMLSCHYS
jgi:hypothetical protein